MKIKNKIIEFVKKETVLTAAMVLAVLSAVMIPPDTEYIGYIDFRTLAILFCLMTVMAGLQKLGIFRRVARILLQHTHNVIALAEILVLLCFFFSMLITNDVALITFVPFTFTVLCLSGEEAVRKLAVPVVVLQTIAANLGSMLTPIGNPQNLYLYGKIQMSPIAFKADATVFCGVTALFAYLYGGCGETQWHCGQRCGRGIAGRRCRAGNGRMAEISACVLSDIIFVVSVNGGTYDSLSGNAWNCGAWCWNHGPRDHRKSGLFAAADLRGIFYFYRKYRKNACFLQLFTKNY